MRTIALCHKRGVTQIKQIADVLDVSQQVLYYWMKKDRALEKAIRFGVIDTAEIEGEQEERAAKLDKYADYGQNAQYEAYQAAGSGSYTDYRDYILNKLGNSDVDDK